MAELIAMIDDSNEELRLFLLDEDGELIGEVYDLDARYPEECDYLCHLEGFANLDELEYDEELLEREEILLCDLYLEIDASDFYLDDGDEDLFYLITEDHEEDW